MSNKIFYSSPRARFFDNNGNPLSNGRVSFYEAGTTTLKTIYTDITQTNPAPNPALLDADGYVRDQGIWLGGGRYKFKLDRAILDNPDVNENTDFAELWTMDNIEGASVLNSGELSTIVVATIADLRGLTVGEYSLVYVAGYWVENDGGGGWFNYSPNENEDDNGGTVISPNGSPATGRYLRNLENWEVSVQYFGATSTAPVVVGTYCQIALTWCLANARSLVFPADNYTFGSSQTYLGDLTITIKENAVFNVESTSVTISFTPTILNVEGKTNHRGDDVTLVLNPTTPTTFRPEHWGATGSSADDFEAFVQLDGNYGNSRLVLSGSYDIVRPQGSLISEFSTQNMHIVKGAVVLTDTLWNIGSYTFDDGVDSCFVFEADKIQSLADPVLYLNHFSIISSLSDANFAFFADAVTNLGTRHGSFKLLTGGNYRVNGITAIPSYSMDLFIAVGNKIEAVTDSELPRLTNGVNDFDILNVSGANIQFSNNAHSILWWGASTTSTGTSQLDGVKKALECASLGSNRGVVYGNNEVLSLSSSLSAPALNVELRDLEISITSGLTFNSASSDIIVTNCRLTGISFTNCTSVVLENSKLFGATDHTITSDIIEISRCNIVMDASETLTLTATDELYYEGNRSNSGRFNFTTGSSTNVISNNRFNGLALASGSVSESFIKINGGSYTEILSNNIKGVESLTATATGTFIEFVGSAESVKGLNCENNYNYSEVIGSVQKWQAYKVGGYANDGHEARVIGELIKNDGVGFQTNLGTQISGTFDSASGGNATFNVYTDMIFPYNVGAFVLGAPPLFYVSGSASGFDEAYVGRGLQLEVKEVTGTGGNCTIHYEARLPASSGFSTDQYALVFASVEKQKLIDIGRYVI